MRLQLTFLMTMFFVVSATAQEIPWPTPAESDFPMIKSYGARVEDFVPKGFDIVSKVTGDLNGDSLDDIALHIKGSSRRFITTLKYGDDFDTNPRILVILLAERSGRRFRLAVQNNKFIARPASPANSEPFQDMSIRKGVLRLNFELWQSMGSWAATNASYKFRYRNDKLVLIGADREDYMRNAEDSYKVSYNFVTGRVKRTEGIRTGFETNSTNARLKTEWSKIRKVKPPPLKDLGPVFSWEVEPDSFI